MKDLIEQAKELMQWADEYGIDEIRLSNGEDRIHIARNSQGTSAVTSQIPATPSSGSNQRVKKVTGPSETSSKDILTQTIASPMVGTFYRSPSPEAKPFVNVGDQVKSGDTVCIVEAMKVMNQIKASHSGIIRKIAVSNAEVVYKGQVLFEISDS